MRKTYLVTIRCQISEYGHPDYMTEDYTTSIENIDHDFEKVRQKIDELKLEGKTPILIFHHIATSFTPSLVGMRPVDSILSGIRNEFQFDGHNKNPYPNTVLYWRKGDIN